MNDNPEAGRLVFGEHILPDDMTSCPLVTFALFAYNQEGFIREAVEGAFAQVYEPLEIILSDDSSTDQTFEIIQEMAGAYLGPHKLLVRRNKRNLGIACHVNAVLDMAKGSIVVIAAGDDISYSSRTSTSVSLMQGAPSCSAVLVSADIINNTSVVVGEKFMCHSRTNVSTQDLDKLLKHRAKTFGAGRAIRKSVWDKFPPISSSCPTEDTPLLLRSLMCGPIILSSKKELAYRRHETNLSGVVSILSMNIDDISTQYNDDIRYSVLAKIISDEASVSLTKWVEANARSRSIINKIQSSSFLTAGDIHFALFSAVFPVATRFKILLKYLSLFLILSGGSRWRT